MCAMMTEINKNDQNVLNEIEKRFAEGLSAEVGEWIESANGWHGFEKFMKSRNDYKKIQNILFIGTVAVIVIIMYKIILFNH